MALRKKPAHNEPHAAYGWGLPVWWVPLIITALAAHVDKDLDGVEIFCGARELTNACRRAGLAMACMDKATVDARHDVTQPEGIKIAINYLCRCRPHSLIWLGIVCSSWVFVGRSNAGRYGWWPEGDGTKAYTQLHNHIAQAGVHLASLAYHLGLIYVVENPITSVLFDWDPMRLMLRKTGAVRVVVNLNGFQAPTLKTLCLWGTAPWLESLQERAHFLAPFAPPPTQELVKTTVSRLGISNWTTSC